MKAFLVAVLVAIFVMAGIPSSVSVAYAAAEKPAKAKPSQNTKKAAPNKNKSTVKKKTSSKKSTAKKKSSGRKATQSAGASETNENRFAALVVDASTGQILYEKNAGQTRFPASLTKMMTLYLTFDALKHGKLDMDDRLPVSAKAAQQPQTNISLSEGDRLPVKAAIESLVIRSANDSAMVLAEALGGTQWNFALMMTNKAKELGMKDTIFKNPSGLPDDRQVTTAYDMARLGIALRRDFPEYYDVFKLRSFSYNGVTYPTHNRVMARFDGADGLKTGYIRASGFNLVTSVKRDGYNIVAVIMGGQTAAARDNQMVAMLERTFAELEQGKYRVARNNSSHFINQGNFAGNEDDLFRSGMGR